MKKLLNYLLIIAVYTIGLNTNLLAQSMYVKNNTTCAVEVMLRGHDDPGGAFPSACALISTVFTVGSLGDITFPDVTTLDCTCTPEWSGGPYGLSVSGPFGGSGWDGAYIRGFCASPPSCAPWNTLGPCFSTTTISVMGCTSVSADWVYDSVNDMWEVAIY